MSKVQREQIWQRHDLGLKGFFGLNSIFLELMQNFVDSKWASSIDEITVTKVEKSFVRKDYVAREAEMLDQCMEYDEFEEALQHAIMEFGKPDTDPQVCKLWKTWFSKIVSVFLNKEEQKKVMQAFDQLSLEEVNDMRSNFVYSIDRLIKNSRKEGRAEGRAEGREEGIFEVIENLLKMGVSEKLLSDATHVPVDEIRRISQS